MQLETMISSALHAVGYDRETEILEVIFNTGRIYQYTHVPPEVFQALRDSPSPGRYFTENIRDSFPYWSFHSPRTRSTRSKGRAAS